jgi:nucleoside-diphosphate-sugar epimerase
MPLSLVTGASGAIGRFLLPRLLAAGHDVIALSRTSRACDDPRLRWVIGDLDAAMPAFPALDAIFSCGPLDAFARWFTHASLQGHPRVVAFGSMSITSKQDSDDAAERSLVTRLREAEQGLVAAAAARDCAWTVLRPTLIYGAGIDRSLTPLAHFATRWRVFPRLPLACGMRQPVHADDLAAACIAVAGNRHAENRTYALGGGERLAFDTMLERVRASLPVRVLSLPLPVFGVRRIAELAHAVGLPRLNAASLDRLYRDLVADNDPASTDFGWSPRGFHPDAATWQPHPLPADLRGSGCAGEP